MISPSDTRPVQSHAHAELRRSLGGRPRRVPPRWLYDERGSELFDEITRLPEYYQTEAEREILQRHSITIAERTGATTVIELGSGTSDKTRTLLDAFVAHGAIELFAPLDVSGETLHTAATMLRSRYTDLTVTPVVADFTADLAHLPTGGVRLVALLGGTIGNFYVEQRSAFLGALWSALAPGDWLLLGLDLLKPLDRLVAAYDDAGGVTDAFIRNALQVINRELGADFDVGNFDYVPLWDPREQRIDMRLRANEPERVRIEVLDLDLDLAPGEELQIEISAKFDPETMTAELSRAGFGDTEIFTDSAGDFGLALAERLA
jgi:L-histidine Nalpha-methyltransferase